MSFSNAIVVGSGVGGLMTARVLSDHFDHVTLIDRDSIPEAPGFRKGVPQGNHLHAMLPGDLGIMNELFPALDKDLEDKGSLVQEPHQFYFFTPEGKSYNNMRFQPEPAAPPPGWPKGHIQTRGLLEHCIRKRVESITNIDTRYDSMVRDLLLKDGRITGVRIDSAGEQLEADLVIDATGKVSRTLGWMEALGYNGDQEYDLSRAEGRLQGASTAVTATATETPASIGGSIPQAARGQ